MLNARLFAIFCVTMLAACNDAPATSTTPKVTIRDATKEKIVFPGEGPKAARVRFTQPAEQATPVDEKQPGLEIQPITMSDKDWAQGGYNCIVIDPAINKVILYTEGRAVMRINGRAVMLEQGSGDSAYSFMGEHGTPLVVLDDVGKPARTVEYETTEQPRHLTLISEGVRTGVDVILRCES